MKSCNRRKWLGLIGILSWIGLLAPERAGAQDEEVLEQWAFVANASSRHNLGNIADHQLTGPPDSNCEIRDDLDFDFVYESWRPADPNAGLE